MRIFFLWLLAGAQLVTAANGQIRPFDDRGSVGNSFVGTQTILDDARRIDWQPGIPGGIPDVPPVVDVTDFGAVGDGVADDTQAIQDAIGAVPQDGGAVFLPAGTYLVTDTLELGSGVVLRGAGSDRSRIQFDLGEQPIEAIEVQTFQRGDWVDLVSGFEKGSTVLTVADATPFTAPGFAEVEVDNDPDLHYTDPEWDQPWAAAMIGEIVEVVAVNGDQLTLARPLSISYNAAFSPRIRTQGFVEFTGFERLALERLDPGDGHTILFKNAAYVWLREVESEMTFRSHVSTDTVFHCEIRDSFFHLSHDYGGGGHGYGVNLGRHTTGCLVENNVFSTLRHSMLIQVGANANVFGYNFSRDPISDTPSKLADISVHGHYPFFNLFEGNVVQEVGITDFWGPAGPGNTLLRNCVESETLLVNDHSNDQNLIGNVLSADPPNEIEIRPEITGTLLHGNVEDGVLTWSYSINPTVIPNTYYLEDTPPLFWNDLPWPSTGGDRPDSCRNPARDRWDAGDP